MISPEISLLDKTANCVRFRVDSPRDVFVLYTELYHPGFKAAIDGTQVPVLKAMGTLKAVEMPKGDHTLEFVFQPLYRYALIFYLTAALVFFAGLFVWVFFQMVRWCSLTANGPEPPL